MKPEKLIAGNWKMNGTMSLVEEFSRIFKCTHVKKNVDVLICPPFPYLLYLYNFLKKTKVKVGGQNCHHETGGAFTGDVSSEMLAECGASHVILGHSERRQFYNSECELIFQKLLNSLKAKLIPIVCVGETLEHRNNNRTKIILEKQLDIILRKELCGKQFVIAYEPLWAIGTGKVASNPQIAEAHKFIRTIIKSKLGEQTSAHTKILYGGSVNPNNCKEILKMEEVNGALVGGASLSPHDFLRIINYI